MGQYAVLVSWTEEGVRSVAKVPQRTEQLRAAVEAAGGRVVAFLHTMGAYDAVAILDVPSDEVVNELLLRFGAQGFARTTTLKGWSTTEFSKLAAKL